MKIPRRFKLLGQTIEVVFKDDLAHREDDYGQAVYRDNEIVLQRSTEAIPRLPGQLEAAFCHELCHWMLYMAGDYEIDGHRLNDDNVLISLLGGALHQVLTTMEYDSELGGEM